jgi:response regulator RpfG family c-di-GMP phosphodiesterase
VDLIISDMRMPEMDGALFLSKAFEICPDTIRILLTGYSDLTSTISAINEGKIYKYISKPWEDNDIKLTVQRALEQRYLERERKRLQKLTQKQNKELKALNEGLEQKVKERTEKLRQTMAELELSHERLKKSYTSSVKVFANLVEMRERKAAGHAQRVADRAHKLAHKMGLSRSDTQDVLFAGLLHDIGKIGLPDKIAAKPFHALEQTERLEVIKHPVVGQAVLMSLEPLQEAASLIRSHHEHYDGKGYPDGLKGTEIPLGARILSVANDYDALQIGTEWTQRMSSEEAKEFISRNKGKRYDPEVVEAFINLEGDSVSDIIDERLIALRSKDLRAGMVLAKSLRTKDNLLLLSEGYVLEENLIEKIRKFEKSLDCEFVVYIHSKGK